ncbi:MAG: zinc ribbon domain-containing protein [Candidatus Woesearchaeota archaeon]
MVCPKCGAKVDADDEFCPDCGAKIRAQPAEAMQAVVRPKMHWFLKAVIIIIIIVFLLRACASFSSFSSQPQLPELISQPEEYAQEAPAQSERLISIETSPPRVNPIPAPLFSKPDKSVECSAVSVSITDACFSCGLVDCGLLAKVENKGKKPIIAFNTKSYMNELNTDESRAYTPMEIGMSGEIGIHKTSNEIRMVEIIPVIVVGGEEIACEAQAVQYGNAYGNPFGECNAYWGTEANQVAAEATPSYGYDATYDMGY